MLLLSSDQPPAIHSFIHPPIPTSWSSKEHNSYFRRMSKSSSVSHDPRGQIVTLIYVLVPIPMGQTFHSTIPERNQTEQSRIETKTRNMSRELIAFSLKWLSDMQWTASYYLCHVSSSPVVAEVLLLFHIVFRFYIHVVGGVTNVLNITFGWNDKAEAELYRI